MRDGKIKRWTTYVYTAWIVRCGWCGEMHAKATDGRNLYCSNCGH